MAAVLRCGLCSHKAPKLVVGSKKTDAPLPKTDHNPDVGTFDHAQHDSAKTRLALTSGSDQQSSPSPWGYLAADRPQIVTPGRDISDTAYVQNRSYLATQSKGRSQFVCVRDSSPRKFRQYHTRVKSDANDMTSYLWEAKRPRRDLGGGRLEDDPGYFFFTSRRLSRRQEPLKEKCGHVDELDGVNLPQADPTAISRSLAMTEYDVAGLGGISGLNPSTDHAKVIHGAAVMGSPYSNNSEGPPRSTNITLHIAV
ncbi:uncharacterized protein N7459_000111 [Penicillium hispanicum]|uniref:uncharacterized protein n=1 Tax=Penicillium hispanicum TaxID=1080232 RepID=UPI002541CCAF|nr:uncharacterized protein N7459_000111 [Penicillium hispanicum]KAJ5593903.1 hypothetical protein N7459_000111 [Penicillium hispanicum]